MEARELEAASSLLTVVWEKDCRDLRRLDVDFLSVAAFFISLLDLRFLLAVVLGSGVCEVELKKRIHQCFSE